MLEFVLVQWLFENYACALVEALVLMVLCSIRYTLVYSGAEFTHAHLPKDDKVYYGTFIVIFLFWFTLL